MNKDTILILAVAAAAVFAVYKVTRTAPSARVTGTGTSSIGSTAFGSNPFVAPDPWGFGGLSTNYTPWAKQGF